MTNESINICLCRLASRSAVLWSRKKEPVNLRARRAGRGNTSPMMQHFISLPNGIFICLNEVLIPCHIRCHKSLLILISRAAVKGAGSDGKQLYCVAHTVATSIHCLWVASSHKKITPNCCCFVCKSYQAICHHLNLFLSLFLSCSSTHSVASSIRLYLTARGEGTL